MNGLFIGYMIGYLIAIGALWWGMKSIEAIPQPWPSVVALALAGLGIVYALSRAQTDAAHREQARGGNAQGNAPQQGNASQQGNAPQQGGSSQQSNNPPQA